MLAFAALGIPRWVAARAEAAGQRGLEGAAAVAMTFFVIAGLAVLIAFACFVLTIVRRRGLTSMQSVLGVAPFFLSILGLGLLWVAVRLGDEPTEGSASERTPVPRTTTPAGDAEPVLSPDQSQE